MLVIVDMQKRILDEKDENFVAGANAIIPKIQRRLKKARASDELILFTRDIPIEHKNKSEELERLQIVEDLTPLPEEYVFKKNYYALPPESLIRVRGLIEERKEEKSRIEVVGVELSLCVLANTLALQGALPEADFYVDSDLVASNQLHEATLNLMRSFNIEIE